MIRSYKPTSPARRFKKTLKREVTTQKAYKGLISGIIKQSGRNKGTISTRHKEIGARKHYRIIDFKRNKDNIKAVVFSVEYDPNRGASISLLHYADGEKRYILTPDGLKAGMTVISGKGVEPVLGNCLPLSDIPLGVAIHNIEINPGAGGVLVKGAGNYALITAKEGNYVQLKLPSGEVKQLLGNCRATIGILSNIDKRNTVIGKAGTNRYLGKRPTVRGVAMSDPKHDHPHAGSYGKSGIGKKFPKTPWGKNARGVKTRKRRHTDFSIVKSRHELKKRN